MSQSRPLITFLSDFGLSDGSVGVCHGVMHKIAPEALVIDVAHDLSPFQLIPASYLFRSTMPYFEIGVHIAVVDPGVGTDRRAVAMRTGDGRTLVGPDNGLLMPVAHNSGGVEQAVEISGSPFRNDWVSRTFHGRDIFCPVGAYLAAGKRLSEVGAPLDLEELTELSMPKPTISKGEIDADALFADRFGNVSLNLEREQMSEAGFSPGSQIDLGIGSEVYSAVWRMTFDDSEPGDLILFEDSFGAVAVATSHDSVRDLLKMEPVCKVKLKEPH